MCLGSSYFHSSTLFFPYLNDNNLSDYVKLTSFPAISVAVLFDDDCTTQNEFRVVSMLQLELGPQQKPDSEMVEWVASGLLKLMLGKLKLFQSVKL